MVEYINWKFCFIMKVSMATIKFSMQVKTCLLRRFFLELRIILKFAILVIQIWGFFSLELFLSDMRNSFNLLLIALACFDNVYLCGGILEAFRKHFDLVSRSDCHLLLFENKEDDFFDETVRVHSPKPKMLLWPWLYVLLLQQQVNNKIKASSLV